MALNSPAIKARFKATIYNGLVREFTYIVSQGRHYPPIADEYWHKLADAISDIALDIVDEIKTNADVIPGQITISQGVTGPTATPGFVTAIPSLEGKVVTIGKIE